MFKNNYFDLLKAIVNKNYEIIEQICEEKLTMEVAAKIYEFQN